jgi:hypothetical protein
MFLPSFYIYGEGKNAKKKEENKKYIKQTTVSTKIEKNPQRVKK